MRKEAFNQNGITIWYWWNITAACFPSTITITHMHKWWFSKSKNNNNNNSYYYYRKLQTKRLYISTSQLSQCKLTFSSCLSPQLFQCVWCIKCVLRANIHIKNNSFWITIPRLCHICLLLIRPRLAHKQADWIEEEQQVDTTAGVHQQSLLTFYSISSDQKLRCPSGPHYDWKMWNFVLFLRCTYRLNGTIK